MVLTAAHYTTRVYAIWACMRPGQVPSLACKTLGMAACASVEWRPACPHKHPVLRRGCCSSRLSRRSVPLVVCQQQGMSISPRYAFSTPSIQQTCKGAQPCLTLFNDRLPALQKEVGCALPQNLDLCPPVLWYEGLRVVVSFCL